MMHKTMSTRDNVSTEAMILYDAHFQAAGMWNKRTGRAMLGDTFYVCEDADTGREKAGNDGEGQD